MDTRARFLEVDGLSESDLQKWRGLAADAVEPNPFYEPEFVLAAVAHLGEKNVTLLVVERGDAWEACLPCVVRRWRWRLPAVIAWEGPYTYLCTPLVRAGDIQATLESLLAAIPADLGGRAVVVENARGDGIVGKALCDLSESDPEWNMIGEIRVQRAALLRRSDGLHFDHLSRRHQRELSRQRRRLEELIGHPLVTTDRAGDDAAVERFIDLEQEGWKGAAATAFGSSPAHASFFREVCRSFAALGRLQLLELRGGSATIAMKCNLLAGQSGFTFKIARAESMARFSPGILLELENARVFHELGLEWLDSCAAPDNAMINRLWPDRRQLVFVILARGKIRSRVARALYSARIRLRKRRHPEWLDT